MDDSARLIGDVSADIRCAGYLREHPGARRVMAALRDKYRSLGRVGGRAGIDGISREEADFLAGLRMRPRQKFAAGSDVLVSLEAFERAFDGTSFSGATLSGLLEAFFGERIVPRREELRLADMRRDSFRESVMSSLRTDRLRLWFDRNWGMSDSHGGRLLMIQYDQDGGELGEALLIIDKAFMCLDETEGHLVLPVFAARVTHDPHGFDSDTLLFRLLVTSLAWTRGKPVPANAEEKNALLFECGIINDTGRRTVMTYGLDAVKGSGESKGWRRFFEMGEPLTLSLMNLADAVSVTACSAGPGGSDAARVYCFGNPSVFLEAIRTRPAISAVCTSGQINLSALVLMDMLVEAGARLSYSGDYDPEGLIIADRLRARYGGRLELMGFTPELYGKAVSGVAISDRRLKQLDQLDQLASPELRELAGMIAGTGKAGCQESVMDELFDMIPDAR